MYLTITVLNGLGPELLRGHPNSPLMLLNYSVVTVHSEGAARAPAGRVVVPEALRFLSPAVTDSSKDLSSALGLESP